MTRIKIPVTLKFNRTVFVDGRKWVELEVNGELVRLAANQNNLARFNAIVELEWEGEPPKEILRLDEESEAPVVCET